MHVTHAGGGGGGGAQAPKRDADSPKLCRHINGGGGGASA